LLQDSNIVVKKRGFELGSLMANYKTTTRLSVAASD
jgi:hypothetical protein